MAKIIPDRNVEVVRGRILKDVTRYKGEITELLAAGDRDWEKLLIAVGNYTQSQDAADVLSGQSHVGSAS